jgi:NTP pyrophosphatase (non-canonical NTP hydrolase)
MTHDESPAHDGLAATADRAKQIRALYEILETRINGKVWTTHELMLGFTNDVGTVARLLLARDGTWDIDGDANAQLEYKLAESLWWVMVLAERLDIDISTAFMRTMDTIEAGLSAAVSPAEG